MSYNINSWRTRELKGLVIPLSALYDLEENLINSGWAPDAPEIVVDTDEVIIQGGAEGFKLVGELQGKGKKKSIMVNAITCRGEGSGHFYHDVLLPALKQSMGTLVASCVWEGGDSITRLHVQNGKVKEEEVEI